MRTNPLLRRGIAVVVIALLVALAFAPSISADIDKKLPQVVLNSTDNKLVKLTVIEYKADGTIEKTIVEMSSEKVKQLQEELNQLEGEEERLAIYKEYGLIPEDVTLEKLRKGMEEKAQRTGLTEERLEKLANSIENKFSGDLSFSVVMNFRCSMYFDMVYGCSLILGLSFLTARLNFIIYFFKELLGVNILFYIPSVDLMDIFIALTGRLSTKNGQLPDNYDTFLFMFCILVGFVGYSFVVDYVLREFSFEGYAAFAFAIGTPFEY